MQAAGWKLAFVLAACCCAVLCWKAVVVKTGVGMIGAGFGVSWCVTAVGREHGWRWCDWQALVCIAAASCVCGAGGGVVIAFVLVACSCAVL